MALFPVFELMQNFADQAAAAVGGHRAIEMERAMFAVRTTKRLRDRARKRLGTFRAERRHNSRGALPAIGAEIFGAVDTGGKNHTARRVKERRGGGKKFRAWAGPHNATRF